MMVRSLIESLGVAEPSSPYLLRPPAPPPATGFSPRPLRHDAHHPAPGPQLRQLISLSNEGARAAVAAARAANPRWNPAAAVGRLPEGWAEYVALHAACLAAAAEGNMVRTGRSRPGAAAAGPAETVRPLAPGGGHAATRRRLAPPPGAGPRFPSARSAASSFWKQPLFWLQPAPTPTLQVEAYDKAVAATPPFIAAFRDDDDAWVGVVFFFLRVCVCVGLACDLLCAAAPSEPHGDHPPRPPPPLRRPRRRTCTQPPAAPAPPPRPL